MRGKGRAGSGKAAAMAVMEAGMMEVVRKEMWRPWEEEEE